MPDKLLTSLAALGIAIAPALLEWAHVSSVDAAELEVDEGARVQCVGADGAPVHDKYRGTADVEARLEPGAVVQVVSKRKTWRHVAYVESGSAQTGWVVAGYLEDCEAPPAPAPSPSTPPAPPFSGAHCGKERWGTKTGTDDLAGDVDLGSPLSTSIAAMTALPWPLPNVPVTSNLPDERFPPTETQVYVLRNVALVCFKREDDSDFHLVLRDGGATMIGEIPEPHCVADSSPFKTKIASARAAFVNQFPNGSPSCPANLSDATLATISISGVGFFDRVHNQKGVSPSNGIELHPVLSICFGQNCALP